MISYSTCFPRIQSQVGWKENKQIFYKYSNVLNRNISNQIYKVINITNINNYIYFCITHLNLCNLIQAAPKSSSTVWLLIYRVGLHLSDGIWWDVLCGRTKPRLHCNSTCEFSFVTQILVKVFFNFSFWLKTRKTICP